MLYYIILSGLKKSGVKMKNITLMNKVHYTYNNLKERFLWKYKQINAASILNYMFMRYNI